MNNEISKTNLISKEQELKADIRGIENHEQLIQDERLDNATVALIHACYLIGIPWVTEGNHKEIFVRIRAMESVFQPFGTRTVKVGDKEYLQRFPYPYADLRRRFGLKTEAAPLSNKLFWKKFQTLLYNLVDDLKIMYDNGQLTKVSEDIPVIIDKENNNE